MCLNNLSICRGSSCLFYIQGWKKITSEQFKNAYLAVIKDIQDPDFEDKEESNWDRVCTSIVNNINS